MKENTCIGSWLLKKNIPQNEDDMILPRLILSFSSRGQWARVRLLPVVWGYRPVWPLWDSSPRSTGRMKIRLSRQTQKPYWRLPYNQGVTKRCRLSLLTNSALVIRVQMREEGGKLHVSANEYSFAHHVTRSPNKLWRSTSILTYAYNAFVRLKWNHSEPKFIFRRPSWLCGPLRHKNWYGFIFTRTVACDFFKVNYI